MSSNGVRGPGTVAGEITTFTGRVFSPLDPDPAKVNIIDIAHALSNLCRFTGHTRKFYSVAEHSVRASELLEDTEGLKNRHRLKLPLWGLLHDASEAYLSDVARPIKMMEEFGTPYKIIEDRLMRAIATRFELPWPMPDEVKLTDNVLLAAEQRDLMPWPRRTEGPWEYEETIWPWEPAFAKRRFLHRFEELTGEIPRR